VSAANRDVLASREGAKPRRKPVNHEKHESHEKRSVILRGTFGRERSVEGSDEAIQRFFCCIHFLDCFASLAMTAFYIHAKARSREENPLTTKKGSSFCAEPLAASEAWREVAKPSSVFLLHTFSGLLRFARNDGFLYSREGAKKNRPSPACGRGAGERARGAIYRALFCGFCDAASRRAEW